MTAITPNEKSPTNTNTQNTGNTRKSNHVSRRTVDPAQMWRSICWVTERLALSGDLESYSRQRGQAQLQAWIDAGITDIIDVRGEHSDERFVAQYAPHVRYHWFGTHDAGYEQPDAWFANGVAAAQSVLADPNRKVMVHCHMGVNRGPSMGFAILLSQGMDSLEVLRAIRAARPIAGILYAEDAVEWWHRTIGTPETLAYGERRKVREWLARNPVDVSWVISRIRLAEAG